MCQHPWKLCSSRRQTPNHKPMLLRQLVTKKQTYLSWYLARWERIDELELGMQSLGTSALMATMEEIQKHWVSLMPRVVLEPEHSHVTSIFGWNGGPDSSHIVHQVQIRNQDRVLQSIPALIDCSATRISMSPQSLNRLGLPHEAVHITTHSLAGLVIAHGTKSHKTGMAD